MKKSELHFGGFRLAENCANLRELVPIRSDTAIVVANWESRSRDLIEAYKIEGQRCIILNFEDSEVEQDDIDQLKADAEKGFETVEVETLCSPLDAEKVMSQSEQLAQKVAEAQPLRCSVDYSSLPKVVTQTLFRHFMLEGLCPIVNWIYLSGQYDGTPAETETYHQGAREFFSIRGAEGKGGISTKRIGVLALGADRPLIDAFLRKHNYDELHFVHAFSEHSPGLMDKIEEQMKWLMVEHGVASTDFAKCEALTVLDAFRAFAEIVEQYPDEGGSTIDLFCSGPKSHAIAASALVTSSSHVRLVGRVPDHYAKFNVVSTGEVSVTTVSDYTNPLIAKALVHPPVA